VTIMKITWLGHAAFLMEGRKRILIDPFITGNPMAPCKAEEIECDVIAVTHGHGDHLGDAIPIAKRNNIPIIAIHEIARYGEKQGAEAIGMNLGGSAEVAGVKFTMVQAWHSSGIDESGFGFSGGDPAGFIIKDQITIYHAGDTCLFSDMKLIGELYTPEIAMLPIGDRFTMNPETAAKAASWIKPEIIIPMHYNTFPPVEQDPQEFKSLVESLCDCEVLICEPGKTEEV
jgi:L-ascorbate metabolism protein UlaG (beta-lactamase superfamily)